MMISAKNNGFGHGIFVNIPRVKQPIELFILFRAFGITTDKDICKHILLDINNDETKVMLQHLQASIIDSNEYLTQEDAIQYITNYAIYTPINMDKEKGARKKREFTVNVLNNDLFPHCHTHQQKIYFLGYMTNKLLKAYFGINDPDDRDSYVNSGNPTSGTST